MQALGARRAEFRALCGGVDRYAALRLFRGAHLAPDEQGALRAVLAGGVVPQARAAKWCGLEVCPFCRREPETLWHRFWACPRWEAGRAAVLRLPPGAAADWARRLPAGVATTSLLPQDAALAALQRSVELQAFQAEELHGGSFWTDGSCLDPLADACQSRLGGG